MERIQLSFETQGKLVDAVHFAKGTTNERCM